MKTNGNNESATKARFRILPYENPRTNTPSWRVTGTRRNGQRVRENFANAKEAQHRRVALEAEFFSRESESALRATQLSETQIGIAEAAFKMVEEDKDILVAVRYWESHGKQHAPGENVPRLDAAFEQYEVSVQKDASLRPLTKIANAWRAKRFVDATPNLSVSEVKPETVEKFLDDVGGSPISKINYKGGVSKFLSWCQERPRRWLAMNPCHSVRVKMNEVAPPVILKVEDCEKLIREAERFKGGRLVPYLILTLFAGLRPFEARRMQWSQVNFDDGEIRIEGKQSKTGRPRAFAMDKTTALWLREYKGRPFFPENFQNHWPAMLRKAGFGTDPNNPDMRRWTKDCLRHTSISHAFRASGSYGLCAERFGNSEAIIKRHYQGRVSSEETKKFYALWPSAKGKRKSSKRRTSRRAAR